MFDLCMVQLDLIKTGAPDPDTAIFHLKDIVRKMKKKFNQMSELRQNDFIQSRV